MYFDSLGPAELSMSIKFCFFRFDNQNGYIGGPAAWFNFYSRTFTSSKVVNFPHLSSPQRLKYNVQDKIQDPEKKAAAVTPYRTNQLITRRSMYVFWFIKTSSTVDDFAFSGLIIKMVMLAALLSGSIL